MKAPTLTLSTLALLAFSGAAWWLLRTGDAPPRWRTTTVERRDLVASVSATGTLEAVTTVELGTQVSGVIAELLVDYNDPVTAGQVVARVDPTLLEADVATARAGLAVSRAQARQARLERARVEQLLARGAATTAELERARTDHDVARAQVRASEISLDRATRALAYATIRSPIDGVVVERDVEVGQTVNAGLSAPRLLLVAGDLGHMQILASVDEADIGRVHPDQPVQFTVQAWPRRRFEGTVRQVRLQSVVEENVVTYTVVIDVDNPEGLLLPGMTATVDFITDRVSDALCASPSALRFRPDQDQLDPTARPRAPRPTQAHGDPTAPEGVRVYTVDESGKLRPLQVERGITDGSCTQLSGPELREGLELVTGVRRAESQARSSLLSTTGGDSARKRRRPPGSF